MPWTSGTATDYIDLLDRLRRFACGYATWDPPTFTGTGPGTMEAIDTYPSTPTETWTITCTDATTSGAEVWSVSGSVSGAQASATTGLAYDNGIIRFTITGSGYAVNDEFSLAVTEGALTTAGQAWTEHRWIEPADASGERELIIEGPGLAGQDQVFAGIRTVSNAVSDWFNWRISGLLGYSAAEDWTLQPGKSPERGLLLWQSSIPYWMVVNGRRIICAPRVSSVYELLYLGLLLPYALPDQYGYPFVVGGTFPSAATRWSANGASHSYCIDPSAGSMLVREPAGAWRTFENRDAGGGSDNARMVWPAAHTYNVPQNPLDWIRSAGDGTFPLLPVIPHMISPSRQVLGELDGLYWVTGADLSSEDLIQQGGVDHIAWQNIFRTGIADYGAVRLE